MRFQFHRLKPHAADPSEKHNRIKEPRMQDFGTRRVAFGFSFGVPVALSAPNSELRTQTPDRRLEDGPTRWLRHVPGMTLDVKKRQTLDFAPRQIANDKKTIKMRRFRLLGDFLRDSGGAPGGPLRRPVWAPDLRVPRFRLGRPKTHRTEATALFGKGGGDSGRQKGADP